LMILLRQLLLMVPVCAISTALVIVVILLCRVCT